LGSRETASISPADSSRKKKRSWVSLIPYGLNHQHPNAYLDLARAAWENRDNLPYALRILRHGCCDGCALGTTGIRDWTIEGIHLCAIRLQLLRLNTMPAMDPARLENLAPLTNASEQELRSLGRLAAPMVRRRGDSGFRRVSWDEAIAIAAGGLKSANPRRIAWYLTSRGLTNEAYYSHQKVARFFGTNNVDTSARICHAPSTAALQETVGCAATTCSYSDWIGTDLLVFVGSNIANNQPVAMKYLYFAKKAGTKVVIVNPYREPGMERYWVPSVPASAMFGTRFADDYFQIHTGGDIAFFYGVLKHLIENDWVNREFVASRTVGWQEMETKARALDWAALESGAGQTRAEMFRFAQLLGGARTAIFVWSMGITQHRHGSDNVRSIVNLQLARGNVGRPKTGLMPIRGHSGVQGGAEMGAMPGAYVMGAPVSDEVAQRFAAQDRWAFEPPAWKGLNATEVLTAAERGEIDVLWQSGGNFLDVLPEPERVQRALERIPLRIHQDIVLSSAALAPAGETTLLLPSRTRYEQRGGGTETSTERRVIFSPEIPGPRVPDSRDEWEIPVMAARSAAPARATNAFPWDSTQDIRDEIERVCPTYQGIAALRKKGDSFQYGGARLLEDKFLTPDGKGRFSAIELPQNLVPAGMFVLSTRRGRQFNSMVFGAEDAQNGARRDSILISVQDAERIGVRDGETILLRSATGEFRGQARIDKIAPGSLQGYWPEVNVVIPSGCLDASGVPDYNAIVEVIPSAQA